WFEGILESFTHWISNLLKWCLKAWWTKLVTMVIALVLFLGSFTLVGMGFVGFEFFPKMDRGEFLIQIELPKDASLEQTNFAVQKAEKYLRTKSEVVDMITMVGQTSTGFGASQRSEERRVGKECGSRRLV